MLRSGDGYVFGWPPAHSLQPGVGWSGMRPTTADGLPLIDRIPSLENAFVSTGHAMWGVSLALPSGEAITRFILERARPQVLEPFALTTERLVRATTLDARLWRRRSTRRGNDNRAGE
jgi:glycine/D-amino acid oxidase-like deaminating enzyme